MKLYSLIAILIVAVSCQDVKLPEKPENLIPEGKMIDVLTELYLSNAVRTTNIRKARESGYKLDSMLYKKFVIDSLQFVKSHDYYSADIDEYAKLFEKVKAKLEILKVEADSLGAKYYRRQSIRDSLRKDSLRVIELQRREDSIENEQPKIK